MLMSHISRDLMIPRAFIQAFSSAWCRQRSRAAATDRRDAPWPAGMSSGQTAGLCLELERDVGGSPSGSRAVSEAQQGPCGIVGLGPLLRPPDWSLSADILVGPRTEPLILSTQPLNPNPDSRWNTYFKDNEVLLQIDKDVR